VAYHQEPFVFDDLAVIGAYLTLLAATVFHAAVLLPAYDVLPLHRNLILAVSIGLVVFCLHGIWIRVHWAGTGG